MANGKKTSIMNTPTMITAKRAMSITKTYLAITAFVMILALVAWNPANYVTPNLRTNSTNSTMANATTGNSMAQNSIGASNSSKFGFSGLPLLAVPLYVMPTLTLITPLLMLFVYDKNNGVLEYLLSLGMTQKDIYMQYLKAALLLTLASLAIFIPVFLIYTHTVYSARVFADVLPVPFLIIPLALAVVSFMTVCMIAFSALQKTRVGSNQPLGLIVGVVGTAPAYLVPFIAPLGIGVFIDLGIAIVIAAAAFGILMSANKFIRREKLLP